MASKTDYTYVKRLSDLDTEDIDKCVVFNGWIRGMRVQGKKNLVFTDINDGSLIYAPVRCVTHKAVDVGEDRSEGVTYYGDYPEGATPLDNTLTFDQVCQPKKLCLGCSVKVCGKIVAPPPNTSQLFEIQIIAFHVIGGVEDLETYPIQKSVLKNLPALRKLSHMRFRAPLIQSIMQVRSEVLYSVHEHMHKEGVRSCAPNILTASDCEGAGELFGVTVKEPIEVGSCTEHDVNSKNFFNAKTDVSLTCSSQLPLEAMITMGPVYVCQKSFRAEHSDTPKHLGEFLHIESESPFGDLSTLMSQSEALVKNSIKHYLKYCTDAIALFNDPKQCNDPLMMGRDRILKEYLESDFVRIRHRDAIDFLQKAIKDKAQWTNSLGKVVRFKPKEYPKHGKDLSSDHERFLTQKLTDSEFGAFVFVTHWPAAIKSFYMEASDDEYGSCESFDLLAPHVGELFGGSMREWRHDRLLKAMDDRKMNKAPLQWYIDLRKDGTVPHGGWGMGFDRLVMFLTGCPSVRDCVPFPVYYGHNPDGTI